MEQLSGRYSISLCDLNVPVGTAPRHERPKATPLPYKEHIKGGGPLAPSGFDLYLPADQLYIPLPIPLPQRTVRHVEAQVPRKR
jgi:hypothetical protein